MSVIKRYLLLIIIPVLLTGCFASKSFVYFEVLEPAAITYPENINRIGYLNRSPVIKSEFSKIDTKTPDPVSVSIIDTIINNNIRKGFFEGARLTEMGYMEIIPVLEARRKDTVGLQDMMDFETRERLLTNHSLDAIVSLEYSDLRLSRSYTYYDFVVGDYMQEFNLYFEVLWRIYLKDSIAPFEEYLDIDTLYYYNYSNMPREEYLSVTSVLREGSGEMGFRYGKRHIPLWREVSRVVFRGGEPGLITAAQYTDKGEWDKAVEIWKELTTHESDRIAARAFHNLGIYYELQDEIPIAKSYADKAFELWDNRYIMNYKKQIDQRIKDREKLFIQLREISRN
jgi:tetratricopeptide (TPR) repeat protein